MLGARADAMNAPVIKESGQSEIVGKEFVIVTVGREKGVVRYLVVRTWPQTSTPEERLADQRFLFGEEGRTVLVPGSGYQPVNTSGMAYFMSGGECRTMKVQMKDKSVPALHLQR